MGAVLHMVNVRLSPEQILYTINHAEDDVLLVHTDFLQMLEGIWDRIERVRTIVVLTDDGKVPETPLEIAAEYERLLASSSAAYEFPDFDENSRATTFYTTGTTGLPKGVFFSHRQLVLHALATAMALGSSAVHGRLHRGDVYMPITPMFHVHAWGLPFVATLLGVKQVYPGRYAPDTLLGLIRTEKVTFSAPSSEQHGLFHRGRSREHGQESPLLVSGVLPRSTFSISTPSRPRSERDTRREPQKCRARGC